MAIREINGGYYVEVFLGIDPITEKKIGRPKPLNLRAGKI